MAPGLSLLAVLGADHSDGLSGTGLACWLERLVATHQAQACAYSKVQPARGSSGIAEGKHQALLMLRAEFQADRCVLSLPRRLSLVCLGNRSRRCRQEKASQEVETARAKREVSTCGEPSQLG